MNKPITVQYNPTEDFLTGRLNVRLSEKGHSRRGSESLMDLQTFFTFVVLIKCSADRRHQSSQRLISTPSTVGSIYNPQIHKTKHLRNDEELAPKAVTTLNRKRITYGRLFLLFQTQTLYQKWTVSDEQENILCSQQKSLGLEYTPSLFPWFPFHKSLTKQP